LQAPAALYIPTTEYISDRQHISDVVNINSDYDCAEIRKGIGKGKAHLLLAGEGDRR
jgi:hypothetical protein